MSELNKKIDRALQYINNFAPKTEPYYVCYSGGKDSDCIRLLCDMWGGEYELHNNHTTVDVPETVYYIREVMNTYGEKELIYDPKDGHRIHRYGKRGFIHFPLKTMWQLIPEKKMPPTRIVRYCCKELKEGGGKGRVKMTGVRWAESRNRKENHGIVTIIGKPKTVQKKAQEQNVNHSVSKHGGLILNTDNHDERRFVESCYRTTSTLINPIVDWTDEEVWKFLEQNGCESNPLI